MTEIELVSQVASSPWLIILLAAQGFLLALIIIGVAVFLFKSLGKSYIDATNRQAGAMEKMAETFPSVLGSVNILQEHSAKQHEFTQEMRLSMQAIAQDVRAVSEKLERNSEKLARIDRND